MYGSPFTLKITARPSPSKPLDHHAPWFPVLTPRTALTRLVNGVSGAAIGLCGPFFPALGALLRYPAFHRAVLFGVGAREAMHSAHSETCFFDCVAVLLRSMMNQKNGAPRHGRMPNVVNPRSPPFQQYPRCFHHERSRLSMICARGLFARFVNLGEKLRETNHSVLLVGVSISAREGASLYVLQSEFHQVQATHGFLPQKEQTSEPSGPRSAYEKH